MSLRNNQLKTYFNRLTLCSFIILFIPIFYLIFTPYNYGYGLNFSGILLYYSPIIVLLLLRKSVSNFSNSKPKIDKSKMFQKAPPWLLVISYIGLITYFYGVVWNRLDSLSLFDMKSLYVHFGPDGNAQRLSILGIIGVLLVPASLPLFVMGQNHSWLKKFFLISPILIFCFLNLLMGKRQIFLFFMFFLVSMIIFRAPRINAKIFFIAILSISLFLALSLNVGFQRSGFDTFDAQIQNNQHNSSNETSKIAPVFGLAWGYVGGGPELLSIYSDHVDPVYRPFATTNSFILRRINGIIDYIDYEKDIIPLTAVVVENITGMFKRTWGGGVVQLYVEGGYFLIITWYVSLFLWFKYIKYRTRHGFGILLDASYFGAIFFHNLFIFPFKDQNIFIAFLWYVIILVSRHVRLG
jgi:hypothetical protein